MTQEDTMVVYGRSYPECSYCNNLKTLLDSKGITYEYKDITEESNYETFCSYRLRTVPAVFINGNFIGGFTETSELLKGE